MFNAAKGNSLARLAHSLIVLISIIVILIFARDLLIPLVLAFFLWVIIKSITKIFDRVSVIRERVPAGLKNLFAFK